MAALHDLSDEALRAAHARGAAARLDFERTLAALRDQVTQEDPVEALSRAAFSLTLGQSRPRPAAKPPSLEVFHLEILQALSLSAKRTRKGSVEDASAHAQRNFDLINANGRAYKGMAEAKLVADSAANERQALLDLVRLWTFAVRGARHAHQTEEYAAAFASRMERYFRPVYGCSAAAVLAMLKNIVGLIERRLQAHVAGLHSWMMKSTATAMVSAYAAAYPDVDRARLRELLKNRRKREALAFLWNEAEARLSSIYTFDNAEVLPQVHPKECAGLLSVLDQLSVGFGDLSADDLHHLHVNNPVRLRPVIKLSSTQSFCCCPQSLAMAMAEILQNLCAECAPLKQRGEQARADWLEDKLAAVVRTGFPSATVHTSVKKKAPNGDTLWESDVVAIIDKRVLIFEAKSGKLQAAAARGAAGSLRADLKKLVAEASEQSSQLALLLETAEVPLHLTSHQGPLVIDPREVRSVTRLNVLLEPIGPLLAHGPRLVRAGLLDPGASISPSMTIFELETVLEVLPFQLERCFYLSRRSEFERNVTYTADELDLLALYLRNQFNVGEDEFEGRDYQLYGMSEEYARGFSEGRSAGLAPPAVHRTPLWTRLLERLETDEADGWTRMGGRLLRVDYEGQQLFQRALKQGFRDTERNPGTFFTTGFTFGAPGRSHTLALCIGAPTNTAAFQANLAYACQSAFEQSGQADLLLLYWSTPPTGNAYDFIGVMLRPAAQGGEALHS